MSVVNRKVLAGAYLLAIIVLPVSGAYIFASNVDNKRYNLALLIARPIAYIFTLLILVNEYAIQGKVYRGKKAKALLFALAYTVLIGAVAGLSGILIFILFWQKGF